MDREIIRNDRLIDQPEYMTRTFDKETGFFWSADRTAQYATSVDPIPRKIWVEELNEYVFSHAVPEDIPAVYPIEPQTSRNKSAVVQANIAPVHYNNFDNYGESIVLHKTTTSTGIIRTGITPGQVFALVLLAVVIVIIAVSIVWALYNIATTTDVNCWTSNDGKEYCTVRHGFTHTTIDPETGEVIDSGNIFFDWGDGIPWGIIILAAVAVGGVVVAVKVIPPLLKKGGS